MQVESGPKLVVDPAMLGGVHGDDSEYEYEYDETETETFYVNLDLTSYNGPIRSPRRRQNSSATATPTQFPSSTVISSSSSLLNEDNGDAGRGISQDRIQILDFHNLNPIVSYQNQVFSCSWADVIGTELLFASPEPQPELSDLTFLKREKEFDLIAANKVKLLGRKANLISGSGSVRAIKDPSTNSSIVSKAVETQQKPPGKILPQKKTDPPTNQALFLERLMNAKQAKFETDIVRTAFSTKRGHNFEDRLRGWARTEERMAEVQSLNRAMLQGDVDALMALEDIYAQVENLNDGVYLDDNHDSSKAPTEAFQPHAVCSTE